MLDVAPTELLLVAVVALLVIGPKELPNAMRVVGRWIAKARGVARHFRSGLDEMVRQAELEEMEKTWAAENARIMREHPPGPDDPPQMTPMPALGEARDRYEPEEATAVPPTEPAPGSVADSDAGVRAPELPPRS